MSRKLNLIQYNKDRVKCAQKDEALEVGNEENTAITAIGEVSKTVGMLLSHWC